MFKKIVGIWAFIWLISFFSLFISDLAFSVGVIAWIIWVAFNLFTYIGASCVLASKLSLLINSFLLIILIMKIYWYFKDT